MKIKVTSVMVQDQERAHSFYTDVLGFVTKQDVPVGEFRYLTVVSPDGPDDLELLLEPISFPAAETFQQAILAAGIPATMFFTDDIQQEYERLTGLGVRFMAPPAANGPVTIAAFDDTCGNLIQLVQVDESS